MKRLGTVAAIAALLVGGGVAYAVGETTGVVSACATTPAHTLAVNGSPVSTIAGESACSTVTYTVPTVTETVTTTQAAPLSGYLFDDEFNGPAGTAPDSSKWSVYGGSMPNRWGSECFVDDRAHVALDGSGHLAETATYNPGGVPCKNGSGLYESGGMDTGSFPTPLFSYLQGDAEARIKVPCESGFGMWPAWWATGASWPNGGEMDYLEIMRTTNAGFDAKQTLHASTSTGGPWSLGHHDVATSKWCGDFHVFGAKWSPSSVAFTVDGQVEATFTKANMQAGWDWPFDTAPEKLFLDLQTGGQGGTIDNSSLPQTMLVDWVRVSAS